MPLCNSFIHTQQRCLIGTDGTLKNMGKIDRYTDATLHRCAHYVCTCDFGDALYFSWNFTKLARWGQDNMAANVLTTFSNAFRGQKNVNFERILLEFVPKGPIINIPMMDQMMAWSLSGDKPLSEPMMVCLLMHISITQTQTLIS